MEGRSRELVLLHWKLANELEYEDEGGVFAFNLPTNPSFLVSVHSNWELLKFIDSKAFSAMTNPSRRKEKLSSLYLMSYECRHGKNDSVRVETVYFILSYIFSHMIVHMLGILNWTKSTHTSSYRCMCDG